MVTRIYTPPVMSYYRAQQLSSQEETTSGQSGAESANASSNQKPENAFQSSFDNTANQAKQSSSEQNDSQQKPLLASVQQTQRIGMNNILQDFQSTLNALGVDDKTQQEVNAYLGVAAMQAQKNTPDAQFIRQTLRTAAATMDGYISNALQQPSKVVRDWVDALLLQPIDFHLEADKNPLPSNTMRSTGAAANITEDSLEEAQSLSGVEDTTQPEETTNLQNQAGQTSQDSHPIKALLQASKAAYHAGDINKAQTLLEEAYQQCTDSTPSALKGRICLQLGKLAQDNHQYKEAKEYFQSAIKAFEDPTGNQSGSNKLLQSHLGLAESNEALSDWQSAQTQYQAILGFENLPPNISLQAYQGLGNSLVQQNQASGALNPLIQAYQLAQQTPEEYHNLPDILSNLGRVYQELGQSDKAEKAYRLSVKHAKISGNLDAYRTMLGQMVNFYGQSEQPTRYEQTLQRLSSLS